ncbi:transcription factor [Fusarium longipes]|uniref:Transcription factor n=1 Tax=Fusarium longipes TaxID=694270 RepID=A0A395RT49_9HYPO|nr:transcription factor [Fusarium longipes]
MSGAGGNGSDQLNRLSCARCKERKVRCNRVMPKCSRCKNQDVECVYPVRAKRKSTRSLIDPALSPDSPNAALTTILDRLQRLEAQTCAAASQTNGHIPTPSGGGSEASSSPVTFSTTNGHESSTLTPHHVTQEMDAMTVLKDAVDHVHELRKRTFGPSVITNPIEIPKDLAKTWVANFFQYMPACMFFSFVDRRVLELLPDIITLPHIHVDPVMLVIYYSVMYHGCSLKASNTVSHDSLAYVNASYLGCLRAVPSWEREASGTMTDLIAALYTSRLAAEFFDYDLAWKSFKYACEYCQVLNLHRLDSDETNSFLSEATCDNERRGFWEVIQIDLFYRLVLNTPPAITNNPWKVNLPWLDLDSGAVPQGIQTIAFLASSRVSLVIARFFAMLDDPANATKTEIVAKTEELCCEMQQIFAEWQLNEWLEAAQDNEQDIWVVADVILTGYTSIIYMFRKMALLNSNSPRPPTTDLDIPDSPIVEDAARRLIAALNRLLFIYPYGVTMTALFGAYRCFVAFAYLANTILRAKDLRLYMADIRALEQLSDKSTNLCRGNRDVVPLVKAMQNITEEIRKKL